MSATYRRSGCTSHGALCPQKRATRTRRVTPAMAFLLAGDRQAPILSQRGPVQLRDTHEFGTGAVHGNDGDAADDPSGTNSCGSPARSRRLLGGP